MIKKKCKYCNKEFNAKRNDAKFCSSTCRSKYFKLNKEKENHSKRFQSNLKGVITEVNTAPNKFSTEKVLNKSYVSLQNQINEYLGKLKRLEASKSEMEKQLSNLSKDDKHALVFLGSGAVGAYSYFIGSKDKNQNKRLLNTALGAVAGGFGAHILGKMTKESREKQKNQAIKELNVKLTNINDYIVKIRKEIATLRFRLLSVDKYLYVEKETVVESQKTFTQPETHNRSIPVVNEKNSPQNAEINVPKNTSEQKTHNSQTIITHNKGGKIISSAELVSMKYNALNFQGRWNDFFGFPSINFHCAVHGMSGEGKSTFCLMFAHYLAEYFGSVLYVSGEEGFAKTMKDKIILTNASSDNLSIADLRTYDELIEEVEPNIYNFIFIDSLDNMKIGAGEMKTIRNRYNNSAIVTISQSTKDGKMRGSYEIIHDSDIAVKVSSGIAETTKNRFKEKEQKFSIFNDDKANNNVFMPGNTVQG